MLLSEPAASPQLAARRANLEKGQAVPKQVRYRMTEKRLAACWRNLEKARAVAPEIRFRRTEKRLEANRANLRKACERARVTGATLRHGMSCRTLEESLAGAGETLEALQSFFRRLEALFWPGDKMETKLVRGFAQASWRRLRAFRLRARWQRRKLAQVLRGVCEEKTDCSAGVLTGGLRPEHDPSPALLRRAPSPQGRGL